MQHDSFNFLLRVELDAGLFGRLSRIARERQTSFHALVVDLLRERCGLDALPCQPRKEVRVTPCGWIRERSEASALAKLRGKLRKALKKQGVV